MNFVRFSFVAILLLLAGCVTAPSTDPIGRVHAYVEMTSDVAVNDVKTVREGELVATTTLRALGGARIENDQTISISGLAKYKLEAGDILFLATADNIGAVYCTMRRVEVLITGERTGRGCFKDRDGDGAFDKVYEPVDFKSELAFFTTDIFPEPLTDENGVEPIVYQLLDDAEFPSQQIGLRYRGKRQTLRGSAAIFDERVRSEGGDWKKIDDENETIVLLNDTRATLSFSGTTVSGVIQNVGDDMIDVSITKAANDSRGELNLSIITSYRY